MTVFFKRFDRTVAAPAYQSKGAIGLDLAARVEVTIPPQSVGYIPLNIALRLPEGTWALIAARSSLHKKGLMMANGIGVGDHDFCGEEDEYRAALFNFSSQPVIVEKGERVAQLIVMQGEQIIFEELEHFDGAASRGGFGSTGSK